MSAFDIYFISLFDNIHVAGKIILTLSLLLALSYPFVAIETCDEDKPKLRIWYLKIIIPVMSIALFIITFAPSSKTICAMYVIPAVSENEDLQELFGDSLELLKGKAKVWKEEGK